MYVHSYKFQLVEIRKENCIIPLIESEPSEIFGNVVQLLIPFSIFLFNHKEYKMDEDEIFEQRASERADHCHKDK